MKARLAGVLVMLGCGGAVVGGQSDGGAGESSTVDTTSPPGWTDCSAPSGAKVCGGPHQCGADCTDCGATLHPDDLRACFAAGGGRVPSGEGADLCPDGSVNVFAGLQYYAPNDIGNGCGVPDLAELFARNGHPEMARYADRATYKRLPLPPAPTACPTAPSGLQYCGGACGECPADQVCTGRSPMHPISICLNRGSTSFPTKGTGAPCSRGNSGLCGARLCLTFNVDSAAQQTADVYSWCVDAKICQAAASSNYGVTCTTGQ